METMMGDGAGLKKPQRALLSVSDKTGLVELARGLARHGIELISTGGTFKTLREAGLAMREVAEHTGFPEMLGGRIKTLHPKVHGGLLYRRDHPDDVAAISQYGISPLDIVVVNLYPFEKTIGAPATTLAEAIEMIDIGGPAMLRSAAKNHRDVCVLTDAGQYADFLGELENCGGAISLATRRRLALSALQRTAAYDASIAHWLTGAFAGPKPPAEATEAAAYFPEYLSLCYRRLNRLRYGENPHQQAAFYLDDAALRASVARAKLLHGKELSYNNILDLDAALNLVREFAPPAAALVKHNNPCGAARAETLAEAFVKAQRCDAESAFGAVVGGNRIVDRATAEQLVKEGRFIEAIIAPDFSPEALEVLTTKPTWKHSVRLLKAGDLADEQAGDEVRYEHRPIAGGLLRQTADHEAHGPENCRVVTQKAPSATQHADLDFAWRIVKHVRSNAIVVATEGATVGIGAGQMSRIDAADIALQKSGARSRGAVLASDAFFPFRDVVDRAANSGIAAIIQPGGSKRDQESIDACNEAGISMLFTGHRHFRH